MTEKFFTPAELSQMLRISRTKVYSLLRENNVAVVQLGPKSLRIAESELRKLIKPNAREA